MNIEALVNLTVSDMMMYPSVSHTEVSSCTKTHDSIGMFAHDYCKFFGNVFKDLAFNFNKKNRHGINLLTLSPQIASYTSKLGLFDTLISPFVADQWLFAGFSVKAKA